MSLIYTEAYSNMSQYYHYVEMQEAADNNATASK